ncbi:MAG: serine protease [Blastococcus sp.]|nr:serine protease [Blastococcus sp.]
MAEQRRRSGMVAVLVAGLVITGGVAVSGSGTAQAATPGGRGLIAFETTRHGSSDIYVKAADGTRELRLTSHPKSEVDPAWSPDGRRIAYSGDETDEGHQNIWVMNSDGSAKTLLTPGPRTTGEGWAGAEPTWSPDGRRIAYSNYGELWVMNSDGGGKVRLLTATDGGSAPAWSPDGSRIAYIAGFDVWTMAPDGTARTRLTTTTAAEKATDWAPSGSALVYERGGQIWRMNSDGTGQTGLMGAGEAGVLPTWSPDGSQIAFGTNAYGSTTGYEIAVMRADGTGEATVPPSAVGVDTDPTWQSVPASAPGAPTGVAATAINAAAVVSWAVPAADGSSAISSYRVTASPGGVGVSVSGSARTATVPGLTNGTTYTFTVVASNAVGSGPASAPSNAVIPRPDTTAPVVSSRTPAANATGVAVASNVAATFGEAVQGVSGTTFTLRNAAGAAVTAGVTYDATTRVATLNPNADLAADTRYTATLTGGASAIRDLAGNPLATTSWTFLAGPGPAVSARTPGTDATGVRVASNVTATFSEAVQGVTGTTFTLKNAGGVAVAAAVTYDATTRAATLNPAADLAAGTAYRVTLTGAVRDTAGNPLAATTWVFTTGAA